MTLTRPKLGSKIKHNRIKINNILTLLRIAFAPIVPVLLCFFDAKLLALNLFVVLCVTDLLDGYLARKWNMESRIGRALDPVADKCLAICTLTTLAFLQKFNRFGLMCILVIILRELLVTGIRSANNNVATRSTKLSKYKTVSINFAIFLFLINIAFELNIHWALHTLALGTILSVASSVKYCKILYESLRKEK